MRLCFEPNQSGTLKARLLRAKLLTTKEASNGFALNSFVILGKTAG
jgi:hypothetical protein